MRELEGDTSGDGENLDKREAPLDTDSPDTDSPDTTPESGWREWSTPTLLFFATLGSTLYVGAAMEGPATEGWASALRGWTFAIPLLAILLAHEMGHYVASRLHRVDSSPPYFIPMPFFLLGTMGAVIRMRGEIRTRNALLDIGAAGPLAGLVVALPVLVYGLYTSALEPIPEGAGFLMEGRGLLYLGLLYLLKGPIPEGMDVVLNPTAFAGWAGLLVTQINLVPVGQLDGGHVAYALFGKAQDRYSARVHRTLPLVALLSSLGFVAAAMMAGERGEQLFGESVAGIHWLLWAGMLALMGKFAGAEHPPTGPEPLSPKRRLVAVLTLGIFVLLFMPSWLFTPDLPVDDLLGWLR